MASEKFFSILGIAGVNGHIIFQSNVLDVTKPRSIYLQELVTTLVEPQMEGRLTIPNLPFLIGLRSAHPEDIPKCAYCEKIGRLLRNV